MVRKAKKNIRDVAVIVKGIMEAHPKTRDDDFLLYAYVLNKFGQSKNIPFWDMAALVKMSQLPSMESIGRARRKVQELYPELQAEKKILEARTNNQEEYIEFSQDRRI